MTPGPSQPHTYAFYKLVHLESHHSATIAITVMAPFMHMSFMLVFHQSKCIGAIKRILFYYTSTCASSSSFMYLCVPCHCGVC